MGFPEWEKPGPVSVEEGDRLVHSEGLGCVVTVVCWGNRNGCAIAHDIGKKYRI